MKRVVVGNCLADFRKRWNLRQDDLAKILGISRTSVSNIECGRHIPSLDLAFKIAIFFNSDLHDIFCVEVKDE